MISTSKIFFTTNDGDQADQLDSTSAGVHYCTIYEYLVCKITHITVIAAQAGETDNYP